MTQSVEDEEWQPRKISLRDLLGKVAESGESAPGAFPDYLLDADTDGGPDGTR